MITVTTDLVHGKEIDENLGLVEGSTIQAKHLGKDILAAFKLIVGGELTTYAEMLQDARHVALGRMIAQAEELGADAVVSVRYSTSSIVSGAAEILAYGTAVTFKK